MSFVGQIWDILPLYSLTFMTMLKSSNNGSLPNIEKRENCESSPEFLSKAFY